MQRINKIFSRSDMVTRTIGSLAALYIYIYIYICIYIYISGESNGKLPPRTCPECSVPESYRSHDWALVPAASPASKAEY